MVVIGTGWTPRRLARWALLLASVSFAIFVGTLALLFNQPGWTGELNTMDVGVMTAGFGLVLIIGLVAVILSVTAAVRTIAGDGSPTWLIVAAGSASILSASMAPWVVWVVVQAYWATHG